MSDGTRELRWRLLPHGTRMADVPPDWRGLKWREFLAIWWEDMAQEREKARKNQPAPKIRTASHRDDYGWRSLPSGTRYLGGETK